MRRPSTTARERRRNRLLVEEEDVAPTLLPLVGAIEKSVRGGSFGTAKAAVPNIGIEGRSDQGTAIPGKNR
jgi:hypothetical protein